MVRETYRQGRAESEGCTPRQRDEWTASRDQTLHNIREGGKVGKIWWKRKEMVGEERDGWERKEMDGRGKRWMAYGTSRQTKY